ncbi:hypothetical protein AGDE_16186 [Angomonas deanei]|nr:hypothetical protein AGDE_16186 [Angomonas deanei]|eukprot:EPY17576.1 hypothetical protein AGDE_16186 [Angomonas deanei]
MIYRATVLRRKVHGFTARAVTADSLSPHGCVVTHYVSVGYHYYPESVEPTPILEIFRMSQMASPRPWLSDRLMAIHEHEVVEGKRYARRLDRVNARLNALSGKTIPFPEEVRPAFMDAIESWSQKGQCFTSSR